MISSNLDRFSEFFNAVKFPTKHYVTLPPHLEYVAFILAVVVVVVVRATLLTHLKQSRLQSGLACRCYDVKKSKPLAPVSLWPICIVILAKYDKNCTYENNLRALLTPARAIW